MPTANGGASNMNSTTVVPAGASKRRTQACIDRSDTHQRNVEGLIRPLLELSCLHTRQQTLVCCTVLIQAVASPVKKLQSKTVMELVCLGTTMDSIYLRRP